MMKMLFLAALGFFVGMLVGVVIAWEMARIYYKDEIDGLGKSLQVKENSMSMQDKRLAEQSREIMRLSKIIQSLEDDGK